MNEKNNINKILRNKTLFILDWDDTLFPTNWVTKNNINLLINETQEQYMIYFQEVDRILSKLLRNLMTMGRIIIVTNAMPDWIKLSSICLPQTYNLLKKIKVISAKLEYRTISSNPMNWKKMAFRDIIDNEFVNTKLINIISIGDAEYEYQALISLNDNTRFLKSIRFMKNPSHDLLIDQLEVLNNAIKNIWIKPKHLDLKFNHYSKTKQ